MASHRTDAGLTTEFERLALPLDDPFTIARGTIETAENVLVRVSDGTHEGVGAAAPSTYYGETPATVEAVLPELLEVVEDVGDPHVRQRIEREMRERVDRNPAARAAVDTALADLAAKRLDVPLYRQWGLDPDAAPVSSFSIGLAEPDEMRQRAERAVEEGYSILKVKLGAGRTGERLTAVREGAPGATVRVDANGAWTPAEAVAKSEILADCGVEFVEQPVPADDVVSLRRVRDRGAVPVAADESVVTASDVARVADAVDIVVAKLQKCGSLRETRRVAAGAHAHGCEAMIGCMVASNATVAASAHLAPLFDYADLDGSLLLDSDPFDGVAMPGGAIDLAAVERAGTGAVEAGG
ncbi:dipeptide epimerase [Halosimplex litoreum]|uniref:Dipeptide epimerase n=1 Tax=Halosimplex litoreum TaxID=1198301 RepID=A0A7U3WB51_9EURY|nr:dipeptide epimerase [Halosimplex litoreum]QPV64846.1 dipeptide epimerase [Halosimplex litoreum]